MGQYIKQFLTFLWPHQVLELLGPLSRFNCVNLSAWANHNVKLCQCICLASAPLVLLLSESIFTRTICTRSQESKIWGPGPSLAIIALIIIISSNDTSYRSSPALVTGHADCWSNGGMGQNHSFTPCNKQNTRHRQEHFRVLLTKSSI